MKEFKKDDFVKFNYDGKEYKGRYGNPVDDNTVYCSSGGYLYRVAIKDIEPDIPTFIPSEVVEKLWRYETNWQNVETEYDTSQSLCFGYYIVKLTDIVAALSKIRDKQIDNETIEREWIIPARETLGGGEKDGAHYDESLKDESELYGFPGRSEILWEYICDKLLRLADDDTPIYQLADKYISEITEFLEDETKPVSQRRYSDDQKWQIILRWRYKLDYADDEVLSCYRNTVNYFCELGDTEAMEIKAASCAGGDKAFECDWDYARTVYENAFKADGVKFAFEIGKIYYYGYCNNGVPEYEKALYYFSHDVLSDSITESKLYIAEMYYNGYGVAENKPYAYYILDQMSEDIENLVYGRIKKKPFGLMPCDWVYYAKANMLLGDYLLHGGVVGAHNFYWHDNGCVDEKPDPESAYTHYLKARGALKEYEKEDCDDETRLIEEIESKMNDLLMSGKIVQRERTVMVRPEWLLHNYLGEYGTLTMTVAPGEGNELRIRIRAHDKYPGNTLKESSFVCKICLDEDGNPHVEEREVPGIMISVPEAGFCEAVNAVCLTVKDPVVSKKTDISKEIEFDYIYSDCFYLRGDLVAQIKGDYYFIVPEVS